MRASGQGAVRARDRQGDDLEWSRAEAACRSELMAEPARYYGARIATFIRDCLQTVGLSGGDAMKVAVLMLEADLAGADAHGVFRLPQYVKRIKAGGINPKPNITVEKMAPATAMVDGDNGMGHLVMA